MAGKRTSSLLIGFGLLVVVAALILWARSGPQGEISATATAVDRERVHPVLLIGLDGATFDLIEPLAAAGRLPHLKALMERGVSAPLATMEPTLSPAIWTTVATGKTPEAHGILGFDGVPGQSMTTLPTSEMRRVDAFWNILSAHDRSVGVIGWWVTWPAEAVNGYVVSDRVAYTRLEAAIGHEDPQELEFYPAEIADDLRGMVRKPDELTPDQVRRFMQLTDLEIEKTMIGADYRHARLLPEFKYVHQSDRTTADIGVRMLRERPVDVTAVGFYGVDVVSHLAWHYMDPAAFPGERIPPEAVAKYGDLIARYYSYVDGLVGELLAAAPDDATVIVFSDHGFGPTGRVRPMPAGHGRITPGAPVAPDGVLILAGPSIAAGARLERAHVLDLTPTLLELQGLPTAQDMPGRVLAEALAPEFLERVPIRRVVTYETGPGWQPPDEPRADPGLDRDSIEKLKSLGYLD